MRNECVGRDGAPGADGTDATPTQVAEAVATYCNSRGECQGLKGADSQVPGPAGKDGTDGVDGVDGADSQVPGPQGEQGPAGPGPSDAQVLGAVTAYCGQDSKPCVGPTGPEGPQGKPGYPMSWTFTFLAQTYLCVDADNDHDYTCEPT